MISLCRSIHEQLNDIPLLPDPCSDKVLQSHAQFIENLPIVADKYDCTAAVKTVLEILFDRMFNVRTQNVEYVAQLLESSYMLNYCRAFGVITGRLVLSWNRGFGKLRDKYDYFDVVLNRVYGKYSITLSYKTCVQYPNRPQS